MENQKSFLKSISKTSIETMFIAVFSAITGIWIISNVFHLGLTPMDSVWTSLAITLIYTGVQRQSNRILMGTEMVLKEIKWDELVNFENKIFKINKYNRSGQNSTISFTEVGSNIQLLVKVDYRLPNELPGGATYVRVVVDRGLPYFKYLKLVEIE